MISHGQQQQPPSSELLSAARGTGLRTAAMAVKVVELKRIAYDCTLVPSEGSEVCCELAGPAKHSNKDPAGHAFHAFALRQAGHVGELHFAQCCRVRGLVAYPVNIQPLVTRLVLLPGISALACWHHRCMRCAYTECCIGVSPCCSLINGMLYLQARSCCKAVYAEQSVN